MAGNEMGNKKRIRRPGLDSQGLPRVVGPVNPNVGPASKAAYRESQGPSPTTKIFKQMTFTPKKEKPSTQRRSR